MKRNKIYILLTLIFLMLNSEIIFPEIRLDEESNSMVLAAELSNEILKDPSGKDVPLYIDKLIELAPAIGRTKISMIFKEAVKKLYAGGEKDNLLKQIFRLSIDELEGNNNESIKNFSIIKKWNISGPWKKYGKPDIDYEFYPEKVLKINDIEKGRNVLSGENGVLFPYRFNHEADETYYVTSSFASTTGITLWILSDSEYKIIVNGREISQNKTTGKKVVKVFLLNGARGYTVQIKIKSGDENHHPYIRGMVTDEKFHPFQLSNSSTIFNYNFTSEELFSSYEAEKSVPGEVNLLSEKVSKLIQSGNYLEAYELGVSATEKFPSYFPVYKDFIPLLDIMNRENEFNAAIEKFRNIFPDSEIHSRWLSEFYMTRDRKKFVEIMESVSPRIMAQTSLKEYLFLLCGEKNFPKALQLCNSLRADPYFRHITPEVINESGDKNLWRKTLIEETAEKNEPDFYYSLGLAEMQIGLDPVMYWEKGYSLENGSGLLRDLSDLYENSILAMNEFYTGSYTDLHPELRWNAKKRKITLHVYESGRVVLTGEDIIPSGSKLKNEKYSAGGIEFSAGEIRTSVPYMGSAKILYVLSVKDGLPSPIKFSSALEERNLNKSEDQNRFFVKFRISGEEEFSVVKYSGEFNKNTDVFAIVKKLVLKNENENISELDYEVICHGNFTPLVRYRGALLSAAKYSEGVVKFGITEKFSEGDSDNAVSEILRFSSDRVFAEWYSKVIIYAGKLAVVNDSEVFDNENMKSALKRIHFNIMTSISKRGDVNFNPRKAEFILKHREGTVEERTLLAKAILENNGVRSFISFKKSREGLINKVLLYVPENRGRGYWIDFYGEGIINNLESGSDAIVLTGEGFETFPVNPETYIR